MDKVKYRQVWRWPYYTEAFCTARARGFTVHVCNGESKLGDLRIDAYSSHTDIIADGRFLPLKDDIADTVVCDPPWEMQYHERGKLVKELRRILKPGGYLLFNAPWSPKQPGLKVEEIHFPEHQLMWFRNVALIFVCRKIKGKLL